MFGFTPNDPRKSALMAAGAQMLGNNGNMNNIGPAMMNAYSQAQAQAQAQQAQQARMAQAQKQHEDKMSMQRKRLAMEQTRTDIQLDKMKIFQDEAAQKSAKADARAKMVQKFAETGNANFTFSNNIAPDSGETSPDKSQARIGGSSEPVAGPVQSKGEAKGDRFVHDGDEGNPLALRMASLPQPVKQAMAQHPSAAADLVEGPIQSALKETLMAPKADKTQSRAPKFIDIVNPKTGEKRTFDAENPVHYQRLTARTEEGWVRDNTQVTKMLEKKIGPAEEVYRNTLKTATEKNIADGQALQGFEQLGGELLHPDLYTGTGAGLLNQGILALQDLTGAFQDIPAERFATAEMQRKGLMGAMRESIMGQDRNFSNADRELLKSAIPGAELNQKSMARVLAAKRMSFEHSSRKIQWISEKSEELGSISKAYGLWDTELSDKDSALHKEMKDLYSEERLQKLAEPWLARAGQTRTPLDRLSNTSTGQGILKTDAQGMSEMSTQSGKKFKFKKLGD